MEFDKDKTHVLGFKIPSKLNCPCLRAFLFPTHTNINIKITKGEMPN